MFNNVSFYRLSFRTFLAGSVFVLLTGCLTNSAVVEEAVIEAPQMDGVWANALLTPDDERWRIEDLACSRTGCSLTGFTYLQFLLKIQHFLNQLLMHHILDLGYSHEMIQNACIWTILAFLREH